MPTPRHPRCAEAVELRRQGVPCQDVARSIGVSRRTVDGWTAEACVFPPRPPQQRTPAPVIAEAVRLYQAGLSLQAVADRCGFVSKTAVWRWVLAAGVSTRLPGRPFA